MLDVAHAAAAGETIGLRADEHQVQQRVLVADGAGERGGDGNRLLKNLLIAQGSEGVQDQGVADEELLLILLDDGLAQFGKTLPMHPAQRIAGPVFPQGNKLLRLADRGGEGDAAQLIFHGARQLEGRDGVAFGQNQNGFPSGNFAQRPKQAKGVGTGDGRARQPQHAPPQRGEFGRNHALAAGGEVRGRQFGNVGAHVSRQQPAPAVIAVGAVYPVALFFPRFGRLREFLEGGPRVGNFFD